MADLRPYPFGALIRRALRELDERNSIFDLPVSKGFFGSADHDLSVRFHRHAPSSPLGPAAGPQTQMAQNLVLSWLAGCRVFELKTVQIRDDLQIPRPCIDMQTVGYNVEWSQELRLEESLDEYVKGSMLIEILQASGRLPVVPGFERVVFDMSVGYDLAGIQSDKVQAFIAGLQDATAVVDRLRAEIPAEYAAYRDLDFTTRLSDTLTLSTFHGCPPDEIEKILAYLIEHDGLHCNVKLNPMLLGPARARELLHDVMGYRDVHIPDTAFERDARWDQMEGFVDRLGTLAASRDLSFGVKFTNTLIVENRRSFFPASEKEMYLSGAPLHVLAINLVAAFRDVFGARFPISFSAGIDRGNFADAVALGLVPVTVCSDLLQPGGYGRAARYYDPLLTRMAEVGARTIPEYVIRAFGAGGEALAALTGVDDATRAACAAALTTPGGDLAAAAGPELLARWAAEAAVRNTAIHVPRATVDPRYALRTNSKPPKKLGSHLALFDCVTCNKCVPVCPNDANFAFVLPAMTQPIVKVRRDAGRWVARTDGEVTIAQKQQYANFADFCNECGNCDVFCPEDGGPYVVKPRFFGTAADWRRFVHLDGFAVEPAEDGGRRLLGRIDGRELWLEPAGDGAADRVRFTGPGFAVTLAPADPVATLDGDADGEIDLTQLHIMVWIRDAVFEGGAVNYLNALRDDGGAAATPEASS
ncbi:MAG: glutamate synthase [Kofleriaceae bacterium]|nr:glutamate synthase [Kofleriaceae bacterium]MCB9571859.1 glutamate synthase [Kofleriaceae bacterium]